MSQGERRARIDELRATLHKRNPRLERTKNMVKELCALVKSSLRFEAAQRQKGQS